MGWWNVVISCSPNSGHICIVCPFLNFERESESFKRCALLKNKLFCLISEVPTLLTLSWPRTGVRGNCLLLFTYATHYLYMFWIIQWHMSFAWHINKRSKLCSVLPGGRTATIVSEEQEILSAASQSRGCCHHGIGIHPKCKNQSWLIKASSSYDSGLFQKPGVHCPPQTIFDPPTQTWT